MRWVDPTIQLAACGSSHRNMATYGAWEYEVLDHCYDRSTSSRCTPTSTTTPIRRPGIFGVIELMDAFIKEVRRSPTRSPRAGARKIMLSFDEWNVWYKTHKSSIAQAGLAGGASADREVYTPRTR